MEERDEHVGYGARLLADIEDGRWHSGPRTTDEIVRDNPMLAMLLGKPFRPLPIVEVSPEAQAFFALGTP